MGNLIPVCYSSPEMTRSLFPCITDVFQIITSLPGRDKVRIKKEKKEDESEKSSNTEKNSEHDSDDDERNNSTLWDWVVGIAGNEKVEYYRRYNSD